MFCTRVMMLCICLAFLVIPLAWSQQHDMDNMPGMNMSGTAQEDPKVAAKRLADKRESEFNHHLSGFFVICAGLFLLAERKLQKRWPLVRYAWSACFLATGIFVLIFSDTEIWPFGDQTPWYAISHNLEVLQHKVFAVILLALVLVEFRRVRGQLRSMWAAWFFPVVGATGALLLLFHAHSGDMDAPHAMETMEHIQMQHRWFAATGLGIAITNGLAEVPQKWQQIFKIVWPSLLIVLGVLLMAYTE